MMIKKNTKKLIIILIMTVLLILIAKEITNTLALFYTEANGGLEFKNGVWMIKINDSIITSGENTNFVINSINVSSNTHIAPGKIYPRFRK